MNWVFMILCLMHVKIDSWLVLWCDLYKDWIFFFIKITTLKFAWLLFSILSIILYLFYKFLSIFYSYIIQVGLKVYLFKLIIILYNNTLTSPNFLFLTISLYYQFLYLLFHLLIYLLYLFYYNLLIIIKISNFGPQAHSSHTFPRKLHTYIN